MNKKYLYNCLLVYFSYFLTIFSMIDNTSLFVQQSYFFPLLSEDKRWQITIHNILYYFIKDMSFVHQKKGKKKDNSAFSKYHNLIYVMQSIKHIVMHLFSLLYLSCSCVRSCMLNVHER